MNKMRNTNGQAKDQNGKSKAEKQFLLSLFEINVVRYALTIDSLKSENIDPFFMIDFMSLPDDYFMADSYLQYGILNLLLLFNLKLYFILNFGFHLFREIHIPLRHSLHSFG